MNIFRNFRDNFVVDFLINQFQLDVMTNDTIFFQIQQCKIIRVVLFM